MKSPNVGLNFCYQRKLGNERQSIKAYPRFMLALISNYYMSHDVIYIKKTVVRLVINVYYKYALLIVIL